MIDHIKIPVSDLEESRRFYAEALAPLGFKVLIERENGSTGYGESFPYFWIAPGESPTPVHVAFRVDSTSVVDSFHAAALSAGGTDNGAPGMRDYHPEYYGAFVLDPDGHNIEAVNHGSIV